MDVYLTDASLAAMAANPATRLDPVLVRCGGCRFTAPAQDAAKIIRAVEAAGDHVRDVTARAGGAR